MISTKLKRETINSIHELIKKNVSIEYNMHIIDYLLRNARVSSYDKITSFITNLNKEYDGKVEPVKSAEPIEPIEQKHDLNSTNSNEPNSAEMKDQIEQNSNEQNQIEGENNFTIDNPICGLCGMKYIDYNENRNIIDCFVCKFLHTMKRHNEFKYCLTYDYKNTDDIIDILHRWREYKIYADIEKKTKMEVFSRRLFTECYDFVTINSVKILNSGNHRLYIQIHNLLVDSLKTNNGKFFKYCGWYFKGECSIGSENHINCMMAHIPVYINIICDSLIHDHRNELPEIVKCFTDMGLSSYILDEFMLCFVKYKISICK